MSALTPEQYAHIDLTVGIECDPEKRKAAFDAIRNGSATPELIRAVEAAFESVHNEERWHSHVLDEQAEWVHEISRSLPAPEGATDRSTGSMARYWRWSMWEDCMADVPSQVERCLQALCGAQFDAGRP